jgi:hypothetical protein
MRTAAYLLGITSSVLILACGESAGPSQASLPDQLVLRGAVDQTTPEGLQVTCSFHVQVRLDGGVDPVRPGQMRYAGAMGGESARQVLDESGAGVSFFADMAWPTSFVDLIGEDSIHVELAPGDGISPFWDEFSALHGTRDPAGGWSGPWTCYPMGSTEGHVDTVGTAMGRWWIEPTTEVR